ncbi:MAG TPA: hypothetical protein VGQ46_08635 [Thermoanaerobaculia bacterium]|jgi:hypothetical protein|nr:hypothetical protein [Thermoanaerobaculia bacterium]
MYRVRTDIPLEIRRKRFLALAAEIGKQLDAKGISEEDIERDFDEWKKRRRSQKPAGVSTSTGEET